MCSARATHMTNIASLRRPVSSLLILALAHGGCSAVRVNEHRHAGPGSAVKVRVVWDDDGTSRHVAGITVALYRVGPDEAGPWATDTTRADRALLFDQLPAGRYRVVLSGQGLSSVDRTFDLRPGRRMSLRVDVEALEAEPQTVVEGHGETSEAADGAVHVLKVIGTVILVVALVGVVLIIAGALDDDDDCEPCDGHREHSRDCRCSCHL
jgi:hypothetical protein